jgi:hypothetical protein
MAANYQSFQFKRGNMNNPALTYLAHSIYQADTVGKTVPWLQLSSDDQDRYLREAEQEIAEWQTGQGLTAEQSKDTAISTAIHTLLEATAHDADNINCLVIGALAGGFKTATGAVFIVRDAQEAKALYEVLLQRAHASANETVSKAAALCAAIERTPISERQVMLSLQAAEVASIYNDLIEVVTTLVNQYWQAGVMMNLDSDDPLEMLHAKAVLALNRTTRKNAVVPNASACKEYSGHIDGGLCLCALHKFEDDDLWLLRFDGREQSWKRVRPATTEDRTFFSLNPLPTTVEEVTFAERQGA